MSDGEALINMETVDEVTIISFCMPSICTFSDIEEISRQLRGYVSSKRPRKMIVDFEGVRFFSSQVLGLLVDVRRRLKDYGGRFVICGIDPQLNRVFKITHLDRIFEFGGDRSAAIESLRAD